MDTILELNVKDGLMITDYAIMPIVCDSKLLNEVNMLYCKEVHRKALQKGDKNRMLLW